MKRIFTTIIILLVFWGMMAQTTRNTTSEIRIDMYDEYPPFTGKLSYSYVVDEDGNRIKNGPIGIIGSRDDTYGAGYFSVGIKGTYNLSGACKNNKMHGDLSVMAKYHFTVRKGSSSGAYDEVYSMKGTFNEGLPNGNFTAKITDVGSVNVNYKNGVLVGAYSVNAIMRDNTMKATIKGNIDQNGKMIGKWEYNYLGDERKMEFVNGVLINESRTNSSTITYKESSDSQIELAKQYASGTITEESLLEKGAIVNESSIDLGYFASDIMFRDRLINWRYMGDCDFNISRVKYKYLTFYRVASDAEMTSVLFDFEEKGYSNKVQFDTAFNTYTAYVDGTSTPRLLTDAQVKSIQDASDHYNRQNVLQSFMWYLQSGYNRSFSNAEDLRRLSNEFELLKKESDLSIANEKYNSMLCALDEFDKVFAEIHKTSDGEYYVFPYGNNVFSSRYVSSDSVEEFLAFEKEIRDYAEDLSNNVAIALEAQRQKLVQTISPVLDNLVKASEYERIFSSLESYFARSDSWSRGTSIKVFLSTICPLISYEIGDVKDNYPKRSTITADVYFTRNLGGNNEIITAIVDFERITRSNCKISAASLRLTEEQKAKLLKEEQEAKLLKEELEAKKLKDLAEAKRMRMENELIQKVSPRLDRLVGKSIQDFKLNSDVMGFKGANGYDASLSDFQKSLKPFMPLVSYKIESVDVDNRPNYEIHFVSIISVQVKKQVKKYRLPMVATGRGEIFLSSFDMKNAQEVE